MLARFTELLKDAFGTVDDRPRVDQRIALAALLVHASRIDGGRAAEETRRLKALLRTRFSLDEDEVAPLIADAAERDREAVDLYGFTSVLARELDQAGRCEVVRMLWEIVLADGVLDDYEDNLVWRVAELLGVSTRDRVVLRKQVEAQNGGE